MIRGRSTARPGSRLLLVVLLLLHLLEVELLLLLLLLLLLGGPHLLLLLLLQGTCDDGLGGAGRLPRRQNLVIFVRHPRRHKG